MENINVQVYSLVSEPISPIEKLKTIAKLGFAGAEFTADFTEVPVEKMKKVLAENNLKVDSAHVGLDQIEEDEKEFRIGAYVSLRELETNEALNTYTKGAFAESVKHIVGVQFRNVATVGGSLWGRYGFSDVMTIFRAMGAKVQLHHAGILDLDEFVKMPRKTRDILVSVIVPKKVKAVVYLSQRNQSTDFPVLTCAVAKREEGYVAAVGATPHLAENVWDKEGILTEINEESIEKFAAKVAEQIRFGSNMRAGAAYRRIVCQVLVKRALHTIVAENNGEEEKC